MNSAIMPISTGRFLSPAIVSIRSGTRMEESEFRRAVCKVRLYSEFPNFFDLKLREAVSHGFPSFDCYNLGSVVRQLGVDRLARFAGQQINFSILSFDSSGLSIPDAYPRALGVLGTAQVGGDVASHINTSQSRQFPARPQRDDGAPTI